MKKRIDIEDLLKWAYRDELPKQGTAGQPAMGMFERLQAYGGAEIENWTHGGWTMPVGAGEPHPDALTVNGAVRALNMHEIDWQGSVAALVPEMAGLAVAALPKVKRLGAPADIVMVHARLGSRPQWGQGETPECGPVLGRNGKPLVDVERLIEQNGPNVTTTPYAVREPVKAARAGWYPRGAACHLQWAPDPAVIALERAEYAVWWAALSLLALDLREALEDFEPLDPSAPEEPWICADERRSAVRVVPDPVSAAKVKAERATAVARRPFEKGRRSGFGRRA